MHKVDTAGNQVLAVAGLVILIGAPDARLALAEDLGADVVLSLHDTEREERALAVRDLTQGHGVDVAIEASGNPEAVPEGLDLLRDGGTYVVAGHYTDAGPVTINPHVDINRKHVEIRGRWGTEQQHVARSLELLSRHRLPFAEVIGGRYGLEEAGAALADVEALKVTKAIIEPGSG